MWQRIYHNQLPTTALGVDYAFMLCVVICMMMQAFVTKLHASFATKNMEEL